MTTKYPAEIDQFDNPLPNDSQAKVRSHSSQHGDANDAIEAVQRKVGVNNSADPESLDFQVGAVQNVVENLRSAAFESSENFATAGQGSKADTAVQPATLESTRLILDGRIDDLEAAQSSDAIYVATWAELETRPGSFSGQGAFVTNDSGIHVDPVSGSQVSNSGQYSWTGSAWKWLRADILALKADASDLEKITSTLEGSDAEQLRAAGISLGAAIGNDITGEMLIGWLMDGTGLLDRLRVLKSVLAPAYQFPNAELADGEFNYDFAVVAQDGETVLLGVIGNEIYPSGSGSAVLRMQEVASAARAILDQHENSGCAALAFDYNAFIMFGQSLGQGEEAFPALSVSPQPGTLMIGQAVRPLNNSNGRYTPVGGSTFQPMIATVMEGVVGDSRILSAAEVAALPFHNAARGETPLESLTNAVRRAQLDKLIAVDDSRKLVASNVSVSGQKIEFLSKDYAGMTPNRYNRYIEAISIGKGLAGAAGGSYGVALISWIGNEYNYTGNDGAITTYSFYLASLLKQIDDMRADAKAVTGQAAAPMWMMYQTGGQYTRDVTDMSVGMAQWHATKQRPGVYIGAPSYPVTDKGGHLDANGSRWLGAMLGKAAVRTLIDRKAWRPLEPVKLQAQGRSVLVAFRVPVPPLQWRLPYVYSTGTDYAGKGFRVTDAAGDVPISSVEIVAPGVVQISITRDLAANPYVWYASQTASSGNGCLFDSDATSAIDVYTYLAGSGMVPDENVAELVGKPYPLNNPAIAFKLPANWVEGDPYTY